LGAGVCLLCAVAGAGFPLLWLRDQVRARHRALARALPYGLDLLTLSVEAGLDFPAALAKVVDKGRSGPLADELSVVLKELRLGKTREEALRNLGRRVDLPALTSFVQALVHADRMGTPLGKVLRILSIQLRIERSQRAEKLANEAPVKLLLPAARLRQADRIQVGTVIFEFRDLGERPGLPGSGASRSRLWAAAWWGRQRPPARAGWIAGCALVAVAGSGTASWRFDPRSTRVPPEEAAPKEDQPGPSGKMRLRAGQAPPGALAAARVAYDLGRRKLEERRIAPRNLSDACKAFGEGRAHLDGLADAAPLRAELGRLIEECQRDLERQCGRLLF